MAVSLRASKQGLEIVDQARKNKGWDATAAAWCDAAQTSEATLKRFRRGMPIQKDTFISICQAIGINWQDIVDNSPASQPDSRPEFFAYDHNWVGRKQLVTELSEKLRGSCRLLLILGLTGIGKTALAERLAVELQNWFSGDWKKKFRRANFNNENKTKDFASVAAKWLEEWGEKLSAEDEKPERLWWRLVKYLQENQVLVLIDSLEALLTGNEEEGWGDFTDEWWGKFFVSLLSAESCQSRLIVTSQDLPVKLVNYRYGLFWHRQVLYGLDESEQIILFETTGLDISQESPDRPLLLRIGKAYKGHPLVLRVIIGEICESFNSNVQAYWNEVSSKIAEVEKALAEAELNARKIVGADDDWKLHKLTQRVRLEVNRQRLKAVFERLETQVKDAYILICAASVYRAPVQKEGWLMQLVNFVKRLEDQQCNEERKERALDELCNRFLAEESVNHNNKRVLGQHNLVRSVALEHYKNLLQSIKH
ncbi:AAA family ATPase [Nostoc sp. ChiSLP03a]|uniref:AAA family ATPase n=1 Tax=Nostoc sp. ChiSLP03a TaxID=3075380 RepID=UPI002AD25A38|nr:AAA family ATPase [Nostoc sp. ChiSLP03a]MDZ8213933.1 AAA family ATPase [Nostoc sp. ChiSLP03a]